MELPKQPSHADKIKSQVLAKIGMLPRLDHVAIAASICRWVLMGRDFFQYTVMVKTVSFPIKKPGSN